MLHHIPSEPEVIEGDLLKDTQTYLEAKAHGQKPSAHQEEAWESFYRGYTPLIRSCLRARGLSAADLDDCEQEVWKEVIDQIGHARYDPTRAGLRTWITSLARHKAVDMIRRRTRHPLHPLGELTAISIPSRDEDPVTEYEHHEEGDIVRRALAALSRQVSDCTFRVLLLRSIEERDVSEVADALGLTPEQVRYRNCWGKRKLRRLVGTLEGVGIRTTDEGLI